MNERFISSYEKRPISFKLPPKLYQALKMYCFDQDCTMQTLLSCMIEDFIESKGLIKPASVTKKKVLKK